MCSNDIICVRFCDNTNYLLPHVKQNLLQWYNLCKILWRQISLFINIKGGNVLGDSFDVFCEIVNIQRFFGKCHFISKDWLALSQDNVSESSEILPVDCCFIELAVTIQLSALVWYKTDIIIKKYLISMVFLHDSLLV
jgi:hypothetical protein